MIERKYVVTLNVGSDCIHENARRSLREASRRWGADYIEIVAGGGRHHWEEKLHIDEHCCDGSRVLYYDGDVIVRSDCPSPFEIVPSGMLGWTRSDCPNTAGVFRDHVSHRLPLWCSKTGVDVDGVEEYPNSGMQLFSLPLHRPLFEEARQQVKRHGFSGDWVIADQAPLATARKKLGFAVFWIPPMFAYSGESIWSGWTPEMKALGMHFCGPINKGIAISRTVWDDLGPDRVVPGAGLVRWRQGKPACLIGGPELPFYIREVSRIRRGRIAEIGVYLGGLTWYGAQIARDNYTEWNSIDHWAGAPDIQVSDSHYKGFMLNMRDAGLDEIVKVHRRSSTEAATAFADQSLDLVFIDGNHTREGLPSGHRRLLAEAEDGRRDAGPRLHLPAQRRRGGGQ